jgi:hypothetical protein
MLLPSRREFHPTVYAAGIMSRFPEWMKLRQPTSVGFRFVDAILGNELELLSNTLDIYTTYNSIVRAPIDSLEELYQLELAYYFKDSFIETSQGDNEDVLKIKVVENSHEFLTNPPTRIGDAIIALEPSGLGGSSIVGLEWMDGFPSGILAIKRNCDDIAPSSLLYYDITTKSNTINPLPVSGITLGVAYVGLGENNSYEAITQPESESSLKTKYPSGVWVTPSGEQTTIPSGINWENQSFIDTETGLKTYFKKSLNNPYGSGVYNQADVTLTFNPVSGTIKVYDVYNLTSGVPTDIPSSGLNIYSFTSGYYDIASGLNLLDTWTYKGFDSVIPWDILPIDMKRQRTDAGFSGVGPTANLIGNISWRLLPLGGYVDDEVFPHNTTFNWVDGITPLYNSGIATTNIIRFSGHFSKYDIQYQYQEFEQITQISADPKEVYKSASPSGGQLLFITGKEFYQPIRFETSESNINAVRIDPYIVRPGTTLDYTLLTNIQRQDTWMDAQTTDKTIQFYRHNIGYTDNLGHRNG